MDEDEFAALYGDVGPDNGSNKIQASPEKAAAPSGAVAEDEAELFMQLYGDQPPPDEPAKEIVTEPQNLLAAGLGALAAEAQAPPAPVIPSAGPPESDDDDDLMITLDENATSYEPTQNRFQYQRVAPDAGSKPPSQDMDGASAIPGLGFGTRSAIGGIPRSAIPGLGPSFPMNLPVNQPSSQEAKPPPEAHPPGPGGPGAHMRPPPRRQLRMEDAVFPSQWRPGLGIKLPGQTRVSPEEYREFLSLGHGDIFDIDLDSVVDAPWRIPGIDPGDFFNYGMTEQGWKDYLARVYRFRQEFAMKGQIQTIEQARGAGRGRGGPMEGQFFGAPGAPAPGSQFPAAGGGGTDGGADGDQALQSSMAEGRDEHYEAFVTSERPPKTVWNRYGSPWEHTIVLTGHELDFAGAEAEAKAEAAMMSGGAQPKPPPPTMRPHAPPQMLQQKAPMQPRPPPPQRAMPQNPQQQDGGQNGAQGMPQMALPPPFVGGAFPGALPPPFIVDRPPQQAPQQQQEYRPGPPRRDESWRPPPQEFSKRGGPPGAGPGPRSSLAMGMDLDVPPRGGPPPHHHQQYMDRGRPPPYRDYGPPPQFRDRGPPPPFFSREGGEGDGRRRSRSRSPARGRRRSPSPRRPSSGRERERERERGRDSDKGRSERSRSDRGSEKEKAREKEREKRKRSRSRSPRKKGDESGSKRERSSRH